MEIQYGYACINTELGMEGISTNRKMIKRTFEKHGPVGAGDLALLNIKDLIKIIRWNNKKGIKVYRMSSCLFPWMSEYSLTSLSQISEIRKHLEEAGRIAMESGQRLSFHPGQFNVLGSPTKKAVDNTILDLNLHAEIMDLMLLPQTHQYPINIHLGGAYGDKESAMQRFCENFNLLSDSAKARLVVENDDKGSMFSVADLYHGVYMKIGVPITFDYHHHRFCTGGLSEEVALKLASTTWKGVRQLTHYSSCRKTFESAEQKAQAHADYVYEVINSYGQQIDVEIEAKAKEGAVLKYLKDFNEGSLRTTYIPFT
jgi:UV DNA damage endonuclease